MKTTLTTLFLMLLVSLASAFEAKLNFTAVPSTAKIYFNGELSGTGTATITLERAILVEVPTAEFDKTASISFDRKNPEKHGFEDISAMFKNAFVGKKFTVKENPQYLLVMDYDYGYVISGYRFQYSNLTAEVVDLNNNRTVVATIVYKGRFEIDAVADAVAVELEKTVAPENSSAKKVEPVSITPVNASPIKTPKTKEEKLVELKQLYEKQLITKEDYDEQKKKILSAE